MDASRGEVSAIRALITEAWHDDVAQVPSDGWFNAVSMHTVDAALTQNHELLRYARNALLDLQVELSESDAGQAREAAGRLLGLADAAEWGLNRAIPSTIARYSVTPSSHAYRMLSLIRETPGCTNGMIETALQLSAPEVSRSGRRLREAGLVVSRAVGRERRWEVTPAGSAVLTAASRLPGVAPTQRSDGSPPTESVAAHSDQVTSVLSAILKRESQGAVEVSRETGIPEPIVKQAIGVLIDNGYVVQKDEAAALRINDDRRRAIGITVLPAAVVGVLTTLRAHEVSPRRYERELSSTTADDVVKAISGLCDDILSGSGVDAGDIVGVGINLRGHVDAQAGEMVYSHVLRDGNGEPWRNVKLADLVHQATKFPTTIENNVNAFALHQLAFGGAAQTADNFAVLYINPDADGVGCALVAEGSLMHGANGAAGELGHIPISGIDRPCNCGKRGCLETAVGAAAICEAINVSGPRVAPGDLAAASRLAEAEWGSKGDDVWTDTSIVALPAFSAAGSAFGLGMATVLNLINPATIILSGPSELIDVDDKLVSARVFVQAALRSFRAHAFSDLASSCDIRRCSLTGTYAARGAAAALLHRALYTVRRDEVAAVVTSDKLTPWSEVSDVRRLKRMAPVGA